MPIVAILFIVLLVAILVVGRTIVLQRVRERARKKDLDRRS